MNSIFITGIGTGVGKTVASACVTEALGAQYWKPVQAGLQDKTDSQTVQGLIATGIVLQEEYRLHMPASPHLAAAREGVRIDAGHIAERAAKYQQDGRPLVIEGAGGLMVPLTDELFTIDLIRSLQSKVIVVAQNYLGSINHSMLTAMALKQAGIPVWGWIFNGDHHSNEEDIIRWSGYPRLARIPRARKLNREFVVQQAELMRTALLQQLSA